MKRKIYIFYILLFALLSVLLACQAPFPYNPQPSKKFVVVEALLTNEFKYQQIRLSYSITETSDTVESVTGANVVVETQGKQYFFYESDSVPGLYISTDKFAATIDRDYRLDIVVNGKVYTAFTGEEPVGLLDSIRYEYNQDTGLYRISYVAPVFDPYSAAMYELYLDWSKVPGYSSLPYDSTHAKMYFFTLRTMDVNELFQPYQQQVYFPRGTEIVERKYSLTPFFESYIRALLLETHWSGSLFDVEHWNLPTNLSGGALGFFTACSVIERRYIVQ